MGLIGYKISGGEPQSAGALYTYVWGGNGVWIKGQRENLRVRFQLAHCQVRGLMDLDELFEFTLPRVPVQILQQIWTMARAQAIGNLEELYHLLWTDNGWELVRPPQIQTSTTCRPLDDSTESSHARALIEIHSHHEMSARFSGQDNKDETGFRFYGVIGRVLTDPQIRLRVGLYGHFWEIPASWVFELPDGLTDCLDKEGDYVESES